MWRYALIGIPVSSMIGLASIGGLGATERNVDLELVLAADISRSMDLDEAALQRQGYAHAIRHPAIVGAIRAGAYGRIAVTYMEWAGEETQQILAGWAEISDQASAEAFAQVIERADLGVARRTSISAALLSAARLFDANGFRGGRRIIDVSGDGPNNSGVYVVAARDRVVAAGITINGLPIISNRPNPSGYPDLAELDLYYEDCVIGGPARFMVVARGFKDFARAIRRKMFLEIAGVITPPRLLHLAAKKRRPPCDIGEKQRQEWMLNFNE